jgi:hypothetical protein
MTQIFLSYARDDDLLPPNLPSGKQASGFITALHNQLLYEFCNLGGGRPELWRDIHGIDRADQFANVIETQIEQSDLLLVVLSRNWIKREWCQRELEAFQRRWGAQARQRMVVVSKRLVPLDQRPPLLQGQEGYDFFFLEPRAAPGEEHQYFDRGVVIDDRYYDQVTALARYLSSFDDRRSKMRMAPDTPSPAPAHARTIYVAKPAADMRAAYGRIVEELEGRHFIVMPGIHSEIPHDHTATTFIDAALADADLAVHLLGEKVGYAPEDAEPIAKLQLARAALRAGAPHDDKMRPQFHRVIWAPRVLTEGGTAEERDSTAILGKFDQHLPSDKIVGENLSKFVDFLIQRLDDQIVVQTVPPLPSDQETNSSVYVYHRPEDQDYALELAKLLQSDCIEPRLPALEGDPVELAALHREELRNCTSVVLCWANASEVWVKATSRELAKWRDLGRSEKFACRAVVALPPPGQRKLVLSNFPPRNEIDVVLDLTGSETINRDVLGPVIHASHASDQ